MLFESFARTARDRGDKPAIVNEGDTVSFSELLARAQALAPRLIERVGQPGVLGLYTGNPVAFVSVYLAAAAAGIKVVLLDSRLVGREVGAQVRDCEVTHVAHPETALPSLADVVAGDERALVFPPLRIGPVRSELLARTSHYRADDFVVHCTSGTTGKAKGIVLSRENIAHRVFNWSTTLALTAADVVLCTLTLAHCHGIDVLMLPGLINGCTVIAPDLDKISPRRICSLITNHGVTFFSSLPYMYELMLQTVSPDKVDFRRARYLISGSAPLPDETARAFAHTFGHPIHQVYGLSEIGVICFNSRPENVGYIGAFIEGVEGKVVDTGDADNPGGELVVRGKALARGYLDSPESNELMFRDGWLWTQDIVRRDDRAGFQIQGRKSRFVNVGGNKVDPVEIEIILRSHPAVAEAVVAGRRDSLRTEKVIAFIEARTAIDEGVLHAYLRDRVASYKLPERYVFVAEIPRNTIGKVQVAKLLEMATTP